VDLPAGIFVVLKIIFIGILRIKNIDFNFSKILLLLIAIC
jgi:hypothetical protein